MKILITALITLQLLHSASAACAVGTNTAGQAGVKTAVAGTTSGNCATECFIGYKIANAGTDTATCTACTHADGNPWTVANIPTDCRSCPLGHYCSVPSPTADATKTLCPQYTAIDYLSTSNVGAASDCKEMDPNNSMEGFCRNAQLPDGKVCVYSADGCLDVVTPKVNGYVFLCEQQYQCKRCDAYPGSKCYSALEGFYIEDPSLSRTVLKDCPPLCTCELIGGVATCTGALAGHSWDATNKQSVICPEGSGNVSGNTSPTCVPCQPKGCKSCKDPDFCQVCKPEFNMLERSTGGMQVGRCAEYTGPIHATCAKAAGKYDFQCLECVSSQNRQMALDSSNQPLARGPCVCKSGFGDKMSAGGGDAVCAECGTGALSCMFNSAGARTSLVCASTHALTTTSSPSCLDQTSSNLGFYYNVQGSYFAPCPSLCATCPSYKCTTCLDQDSNFSEPPSTDPVYPRTFKGKLRGFFNDECVDVCPNGYVTDSERITCVLETTKVTSSSFAVSYLFSLIALIFITSI